MAADSGVAGDEAACDCELANGITPKWSCLLTWSTLIAVTFRSFPLVRFKCTLVPGAAVLHCDCSWCIAAMRILFLVAQTGRWSVCANLENACNSFALLILGAF